MATGSIDSLEIKVQYQANDAAEGIKKLSSSLGDLKSEMPGVTSGLEELSDALKDTASGANKAMEQASDAVEGFKNEVHESVTDVVDELETFNKAFEEAHAASMWMQHTDVATWGIFGVLGRGIVEMLRPLGQLVTQFGRIARYRILRGILSGISNAFREGFKNMYEWSSALGGEFAQAVDTIKSSLLTIKNATAITYAPLLEALAPAFEKIANWAAQAATAVSRFVAILVGSDHYYTVATGSATSYSKAVGGATQKLRTLLKFDEINRLEKKNQGGGSSGGGVSTDNMFKRMELDTKGMTFKQRLEFALEGLGFNFDNISKDDVLNGIVNGMKAAAALAFLLPTIGIGGTAIVLTVYFGLSALMNKIDWEAVDDFSESTRTWFSDVLFGWIPNSWKSPSLIEFAVATNINSNIHVVRWKTLRNEKEVRYSFEDYMKHDVLGLDGQDNWSISVGIDATITKIRTNAWDVQNVLKNAGYSMSGVNTQSTVLYVRSGPYTYASGGYPDTGQLFLAREAGPEMVGTIGGHTAVANNEQIVQAVAQGVASAVNKEVILLAEQNQILRQIAGKSSNITTGSISSAFQRENRRAGTTIIPVGG